MPRVMYHPVGPAQLHDPSEVHHRDPMGDLAHHREVVGDEEVAESVPCSGG